MKGYKQTILGKVPVSWGIIKLKEGCDKLNVGFVGTCEKYYCDKEDGVLMLRTGNLTNGKIKYENLRYVTHEFNKKNSKSQIFEGDLLVARHGSSGQAVLVPINFEQSNCLNIIVIRSKTTLNSEYLKYQFNSSVIKEQVIRKTAGSTQGVINTKEVASLDIIMPPLPEQQKIAEILSTVDQKIEYIDQQIKQTQELKKGLMQQLLTKGIGHTEFKDSPLGEIPLEWEVKELDDISSITRLAGYEYSEYWKETINGEITALRGYNIGRNKLLLRNVIKISEELSQKLIRSRLFKGDIVFPVVGTIGNAVVIEEDNKYHINQNIAKITPDDCLSSYFLMQYLISTMCKREINRFNATTSQPNVLVGSLRKFRVPFPLCINEQKQIANILSTVDEKLDIQQSKKAEYLELKKGLMQQLLTGNIRVKTN